MPEIESKKVSELPVAAELTGDELLVAEQNDVHVQVTAGALAKLIAGKVSAASTLGPLTVTENGTYDAAYEAATVFWDEDTEYDASAAIDGITLRYKKAAGLSVPDDLRYLLSPEYSIAVRLPDGTAQTIPLREADMVEMDGCYLSNELLFTVVWIREAETVNAAYGTAFEDNAVYVTDFLWMMQDLQGAELTLTAPGKQLDGISSVEVNVEAEPNLQYKHVTENGSVYPDEGYDGMSEVYVDVPIPDGYVQPSGTKTIAANGTHDVAEYANVDVNVPVPPGYVIPSGTKVITENGTHNVSGYENAEVNVQGSGGGAVVAATVKRLTLLEADVTADGTSLTIGA